MVVYAINVLPTPKVVSTSTQEIWNVKLNMNLNAACACPPRFGGPDTLASLYTNCVTTDLPHDTATPHASQTAAGKKTTTITMAISRASVPGALKCFEFMKAMAQGYRPGR
jgi:hypothetical protein